MATSDVKKDGIAYAPTREGYLLPVMDVTHTRFAVPDSPADLENLHRALRASERRRRLVPKFLMRVMLKSAAEKSRLLHALFATDATFLDGTTTYVMKLGADNLVPPFDSPVDRRLASSPQATFLRLRTQQVAQLAAQALVGELAAGAAPLHLVNIGGGPAFDSINALIILARSHPELLGRKIVIDVLDADDAGAFFGGNALAALRAEGQPLAGLDIDFRHRTYDWNKPCVLREMIDDLAAQGAILAASSEGGLFE